MNAGFRTDRHPGRVAGELLSVVRLAVPMIALPSGIRCGDQMKGIGGRGLIAPLGTSICFSSHLLASRS